MKDSLPHHPTPKKSIALLIIAAFAVVLALGACKDSRTNRSVYYDLEQKENPTCAVAISFRSPADAPRFLKAIADFAARYHIPQAPAGGIMTNGRELPRSFITDDLIISPMVFDMIPDPARHYGQVRIYVTRRDFPQVKFKQMAAEFIASMRTEFGDQIMWAEDYEIAAGPR